jgi:hypothetical protein
MIQVVRERGEKPRKLPNVTRDCLTSLLTGDGYPVPVFIPAGILSVPPPVS